MRRHYDPEISLPDEILERYAVDISEHSPRREIALRTMNQRFSIVRRSEEAHTFVILTPLGHPGRTEPMLFVDADLIEFPLEMGGQDDR